MPGARMRTARETDAHGRRSPAQQPGSSGSFTGFLAAIVIVGAVVALAVLFWTAIG